MLHRSVNFKFYTYVSAHTEILETFTSPPVLVRTITTCTATQTISATSTAFSEQFTGHISAHHTTMTTSMEPTTTVSSITQLPQGVLMYNNV